MTATAPAGCDVRLLGPVEVRRSVDGTEVVIGGPKERAVLAQLALELGRTVSVDSLIRGLWGDDPPRTSTKTLQTYVARIRRAVAGLATIEWTGGGYRLIPDGVHVDVRAVEDLVRRAPGVSPEEQLRLLGEALGQWRGEPLADVSALPFAATVADALGERRDEIAEYLVEAQLACGRHAALIGELEAAVAAQPFRERRWGQLMLALYRSGRQADALRAYQRARRLLADELGLEPGADLRALESAIVAQDPTLDWHSPVSDPPEAAVPPENAPASPALPSEKVVFLLTDIEGSTKRWETDPDAMADSLRWHDDVIGVAVVRHGGVLLKEKGEGDSTFSVFDDPSSAASAAVEAQRQLRGHPDGPLPVRMAVHLGDAELRDGDYFGPTVNRAARLRSVAHGGQILVSDAVAWALREQPAAGLSSRELGVVRLKDLDAPERVHQLTADGIPDEFPPIRSADVGFTNIPPDITSFVGRKDDIEQVLSLLASGRLVTLTGAGGSGKTRLSQRVGRRVAAEVLDGAWFVDLAPLVDGDQVVEAAARAVGVREEAGRRTIDLLTGRLRDSDALIILDNCEHLTDASAELARVLLDRCPEVRVLATSRERLRVPEETTWPVPPLLVDADDVAASEAVRLFVDRATSAQPAFRLTPEAESHVVAICRAVDGIPLAIELAAARLRLMSPQQLAVRLEDRFAVLTTGARTALPRQQTLRALVDWSHDLLSSEERTAFRRLSVFRGGFDIDAAEAVVAGGSLPRAAVLDLVTELADKSLLVVEPGEPPRMRMLETLREYGHERLEEAGEADGLARLHAERCAALADEGWEAFGPRHAEIAARVALESDNVRAALRWAIDRQESELGTRIGAGLWGLWFVSGARAEGNRWLRELCALAPSTDTAARARMVVGAGNLAASVYDVDRAVPLLQEGLTLAEDTSQPDFVVYAITALANARPSGGGADELRKAVAVAMEHGVPAGVLPMVQLSYRALAPEERQAMAERAVELARASGDPYLTALAVEALAEHRPGPDREVLLREGLELARSIGATSTTASMLSSLAEIVAAQGDLESVRSLLAEAEALVAASDRGLRLGAHLHRAGWVLWDADDLDGALGVLQRSLTIVEREGFDEGIATVHLTMAQGMLETDDPAAAGRHVAEAMAHLPPGHEFLKVESLRCAAIAAAMAGDVESGRDLYSFAEEHRSSLGPAPVGVELFAERSRRLAERFGFTDPAPVSAPPQSIDEALELAGALFTCGG